MSGSSPIVIIGGGIIGLATAYYLSEPASHPDPSSIHIIDSCPHLFASASGYAGGFMAKDWFYPAVADLGTLSYELHRQLAKEHGGKEKWGYAPSTALGLAVDEDGLGIGKGQRGEDWLLDGTSRAEVSAGGTGMLNGDGSPAWMTKQKGGTLDIISSDDGCAQVGPLELCQFLLDTCLLRGVQLHLSTQVVSVATSPKGALSGVILHRESDNKSTELACKSLLIAAGSWTPSVFSKLFPTSRQKVPVVPLAGYSLLVRSPRHTLTDEVEKYAGGCHAVFAAPSPNKGNYSWAPELISRIGGEVFSAGLNSSTVPLPRLANETEVDPTKIHELKKVTVRLMGLAPSSADADGNEESLYEDDLQVTRETLCFRPATLSGKPIITRVAEAKLGEAFKTLSSSSSSSENGDEDAAGPRGGVFISAGHGPWGISLSLGSGKVMAEMIMQPPPPPSSQLGSKGTMKTSADVSRLGL